MSKEKLKELYQQRNYDEQQIEQALRDIEKLEKYLQEINKDTVSAEVSDIKKYVKMLIEQGDNSIDNILAIARYFYLLKKNDIYIYFTTILGGVGVIENIKKRAIKVVGENTSEKIFGDLPDIPLGSPLSAYPEFTKDLMNRLTKVLPEDKYQKVLIGNNHNIPKEAFAKEHENYKKASDLDTFLKELHDRKVAELQYHCDNDIVWFEQRITQEVVDYVKADQEILSAVRDGNKLYVTKIPYDIENYLNARTPEERKYYACHCQFVRDSLLKGNNEVNENWCYCSAGFTKNAFDNMLGMDLEIKLLESPLKGDDRCRFELKLES
ncbi:MAG: hypothetical protein JXR69_11435 [Candidatus Delongbacteria bacterium]|nr:hypothetical protein [Candidatus Delongbacteria bacterium]